MNDSDYTFLAASCIAVYITATRIATAIATLYMFTTD